MREARAGKTNRQFATRANYAHGRARPGHTLCVDNFTHSVIGIVAGDSVARSTRPTDGGLSADTRRAFFVALAVIGGNLPDSDLIVAYSGFTRDKLAYLLQHRGYTHTIIGCIALALLLYGGAELFAKLRKLTLTRRDHLALLGMALFGTLLHLGMDSLNSYGVHPFWPFNNEWFYGDSVFIVEPMYWIAAAPTFFLVRTIWARIVIGFLLLVALGATVFSNPARPAWYISVILLTALLLLVGKRASARTASLTSAAVTVGVTAFFILSGRVAAHRVEAAVAQSFPSEQSVDQVLSPGLANPFCWDVLTVQMRDGEYTARQAVLANAPGVVPVGHCFGMLTPPVGTAPMTPVSAPATAAIHWIRQFSMPVDRLAAVAAKDCEARELLQFARVPYATEVDGQWVVGDLRFDRERALGMAEVALDSQAPDRCRIHVPWQAPRAALIDNPGTPAGY